MLTQEEQDTAVATHLPWGAPLALPSRPTASEYERSTPLDAAPLWADPPAYRELDPAGDISAVGWTQGRKNVIEE
jgi:hypothetical protein